MDRMPWRIGFFICVATLIICVAWHRFATRPRKDEIDDVLSALVPGVAVFQVGACQIFFDMARDNSGLIMNVFAQNRYDVETTLSMTFMATEGSSALVAPIPPLNMTVPGSSVVVARIEIGLKANASSRIAIKPDGRSPNPDGAIVRFARRSVLQSDIKPWMTVLGACGGGVYYGGARVWVVDVPDLDSESPIQFDHQWQFEELWTPQQPAALQDIAVIYGFSLDRRFDPVEPSMGRWLWLASPAMIAFIAILLSSSQNVQDWIPNDEARTSLAIPGALAITTLSGLFIFMFFERTAIWINTMSRRAARRLVFGQWILYLCFILWFARHFHF